MYYRKREETRRLKKLYSARGYAFYKENENEQLLYWYRYSPCGRKIMRYEKRLGAKYVRQAKFKVDFPVKGSYYRNFKRNVRWDMW